MLTRLVLAASVLFVMSAPALAGGWATVGLGSLPDDIATGQTWTAELTVLRHGRTPTDGAKPSVTIVEDRSGRRSTFAARPTGRTGVYEARVVFPSAGDWRLEIDNGLAATGYGSSQTTTLGSFEIVSASGRDIVPTWALAVGAVLAALAVLAAAGLRRRGARLAKSPAVGVEGVRDV